MLAGMMMMVVIFQMIFGLFLTFSTLSHSHKLKLDTHRPSGHTIFSSVRVQQILSSQKFKVVVVVVAVVAVSFTADAALCKELSPVCPFI